MQLTPDQRFEALSDEIPALFSIPANFSFVGAKRSGNTIWLSGHGPNLRKAPPDFDYTGKIGRELSKEDGYAAARLVGLNLLVTLQSAIGSLNLVKEILQVTGAVNSAQGFTGQSFVVNGCTDLLMEIFCNSGKPTRTALGVAELPFNMSVECNMTVELFP